MSSFPNIVYFHTHDTGRYIRPYGYQVDSPNYQRFAESGITFRHMHSVAPTCSPSRAGLLTGQYPHSCGMFSLAHRGAELNDYQQHLIHHLKPLGYSTTLIGFQHVVNWPEQERIGYDELVMNHGGGTRTPQVGPPALAWLEKRDAQAEQPFFLNIGISETHRPFKEGADINSRYLRPPEPFPDTEVFRKDMAAYEETLKDADTFLGQVLDKLDEKGLRDNTLMIVTTDHGLAFPSMKNNLTAHGTGVLFMMSGPGIPAGKVTDALASQLDVFPTLCEYLNVDKPAWLQGESFMSILTETADQVHEAVFTESNYHGYGYHPYRCIRTSRWSYIQGFEDNEWTRFPGSDDSPTDAEWRSEGWGERPAAKERLFDLLFDPLEKNNLAGKPEFAEIEAELRTRLFAHLEATADPVLKGPIPAPKGAVRA